MFARLLRAGGVALGVAVLGATVPACQIPGAKKVAPRPVFYPPRPDPAHSPYLTSINTLRDVKGERGSFARFIMGEEKLSPKDALDRPYGIAVWQGKVYVADHNRGDVLVFDVKNRTLRGLNGDERLIASPTNLCIDDEGRKFIVEPMRKKIQVFDAQDRYLKTFDIAEGRPTGVAAIGKELFVSDGKGNRILVLDPSTGKVVRTLGGAGRGPGQFGMPSAMARDSEGHLYVADLMNFRFQQLDTTGKALLVKGQAGDSWGSFARPRGIAVRPDGVIFVVETIFELVQMFDQKGQVLMAFGNFTAAPGFLEVPAGIAVDTCCLPYLRKYVDPRFEPEYLVFVASQVGPSKVGVFAFGHLKPGAEVPANPEPPPGPTRPEKPPIPPITPESAPQT